MNHRFGCTKPSFFFFPRNPEEKTLWRLRDPLVPLRHNHLSLLFFPLLSLSFRVFCNFLTINPQSPPYPVLCFGILGFFFFWFIFISSLSTLFVCSIPLLLSQRDLPLWLLLLHLLLQIVSLLLYFIWVFCFLSFLLTLFMIRIGSWVFVLFSFDF